MIIKCSSSTAQVFVTAVRAGANETVVHAWTAAHLQRAQRTIHPSEKEGGSMANPSRLNKTKLSFPYTAQHQRPELTLTHTAAPHPTPHNHLLPPRDLAQSPHRTPTSDRERARAAREAPLGRRAGVAPPAFPSSLTGVRKSKLPDPDPTGAAPIGLAGAPARPFSWGSRDSPRGGLRWRTCWIRRSARTTTTGEHQPPCATLFLFKFPVFLARFLCFSV
jgi:hypothetical protein